MKNNNIKKHEWTQMQSKSAHTPNFGKKYIGEPELFRMMGNVSNKKILELGSGNGYWLDLLAKRGAICTGVEISEKQLELVDKNISSIVYLKGDITALSKLKLKKDSYDIILLQHVLLEISSLKKIKKIMEGAFALLKKSGVIIISDIHPFAPSLKSDIVRTAIDYNYFSSGSVFEVVSKRIDGGETIYRDFHWTLSDIFGTLTKAGFYIIEVTEPRPPMKISEKYPELAYRQVIPMSFWIKAIKSK